jgi:hypothetical protein
MFSIVFYHPLPSNHDPFTLKNDIQNEMGGVKKRNPRLRVDAISPDE